jgi:hypothetical protein
VLHQTKIIFESLVAGVQVWGMLPVSSHHKSLSLQNTRHAERTHSKNDHHARRNRQPVSSGYSPEIIDIIGGVHICMSAVNAPHTITLLKPTNTDTVCSLSTATVGDTVRPPGQPGVPCPTIYATVRLSLTLILHLEEQNIKTQVRRQPASELSRVGWDGAWRPRLDR